MRIRTPSPTIASASGTSTATCAGSWGAGGSSSRALDAKDEFAEHFAGLEQAVCFRRLFEWKLAHYLNADRSCQDESKGLGQCFMHDVRLAEREIAKVEAERSGPAEPERIEGLLDVVGPARVAYDDEPSEGC